jgi:hypothetical protein
MGGQLLAAAIATIAPATVAMEYNLKQSADAAAESCLALKKTIT